MFPKRSAKMIDGTEKPQFPVKFAKHTVRHNEFGYITSQRKIAELFVMALIKREILTSCKVLFTKSCILNNQARIHTGFHRFMEISQVFHNKHIFNNNSRTFQVEIWKMVCTNVFFFQFPGSRQKPGKGNFRELKPKKFSGVHLGSPRSLLPQPLV